MSKKPRKSWILQKKEAGQLLGPPLASEKDFLIGDAILFIEEDDGIIIRKSLIQGYGQPVLTSGLADLVGKMDTLLSKNLGDTFGKQCFLAMHKFDANGLDYQTNIDRRNPLV